MKKGLFGAVIISLLLISYPINAAFESTPLIKLKKPVLDAQFSQNGRRLSITHPDGTLKVFEYPSKKEIFSTQIPSKNSQISLSHNGQVLSVAQGPFVTLYNSKKKQKIVQINPFKYRLYSLSIAPDNRTLAISGSEKAADDNTEAHFIKFYDISKKRFTDTLGPFQEAITHLAFDPSNKRNLISVQANSKITQWDTRKKEIKSQWESKTQIKAIAIDKKAKQLATLSPDNSITLYTLEKNQVETTFQIKLIAANDSNAHIQFSRSSDFLILSKEDIHVISIPQKQVIATLPQNSVAQKSSSSKAHLLITSKHPQNDPLSGINLDALNSNIRLNKHLIHFQEHYQKKQPFETTKEQQSRLNKLEDKSNKYLATLLQFPPIKAHIYTHLKKIKDKEESQEITLYIPGFDDITLKLNTESYPVISQHYLDISIKNIAVNWPKKLKKTHRHTIQSVTFIHPKLKHPIYYNTNATLPKNDTAPSQKKSLDHYLDQAEESDNPILHAKIARHYLNGIGHKQDLEKAKFWAEKVHSAHHPLGSALLKQIDLSPSKNEVLIAALIANYEKKKSDEVAFALSQLYESPEDIRIWTIEAAKEGHPEALYQIGLKENDIKWLKRSAKQGHPGAQLAIGERHLNGLYGIEKDPKKAIQWIHKAAKQGHPRAMALLGKSFMTGNGIGKHPQYALDWINKAAEKGEASALIQLGKQALHDENYPEAYDFFLEASFSNQPEAFFEIGNFINKGYIDDPDPQTAEVWINKAAEQNHPDAHIVLGHMALASKNIEKAKTHFKFASQQNHPDAHLYLAQIIEKEKGAKSASTDYLNAAKHGNTTAMKHIAAKTSTLEEKIYWLKKASQSNDAQATLALIDLYLDASLKDSYSPNHARHLLENMALKNNADAQNRLGQLLLNPDHLFNDPKSGIKWLLLAAKKENKSAITYLGQAYQTGTHRDKNQIFAKQLLEIAANSGQAQAQYQLATIAKDEGELAQYEIWLKKAAHQDHPQAQAQLGEIYLNAPKDQRYPTKALHYLSGHPNIASIDQKIGLSIFQTLKTTTQIKASENIEAEALLFRGIKGYKNGLTRIGKKQVEEAFETAPELAFYNSSWHLLSTHNMPLILATTYFSKLSQPYKTQPVFWLEYAHLALQSGHPKLALSAIKNAQNNLKTLPKTHFLIAENLLEVIKACAHMQNNNSLDALEGLYAYGKIDAQNTTLINYINQWCNPLLTDIQRLSFVTTIKETDLIKSETPIKKEVFYDIINNKKLK